MTSQRFEPISRMPVTWGPALIWYWTALAVILVSSADCWAATVQDSLWLDELHTSWTVAGTWSEVADRAAAGNQGPIYFWIVWIVTQLWGQHETALRSLSWISTLLLILLLAEVTRRCSGSAWLAITVAVTAAFDPNLIYYAREARPYALVMLLGTCHVLVIYRWSQHRTVGLGVTGVLLGWLLFFTHYTAALLFPAELLALVLTQWKSPARREVLRIALPYATLLVVGCFASWPWLRPIAARSDNWAAFVERRPLYEVLTIFPVASYVLLPVGMAFLWRTRAIDNQAHIRADMPLWSAARLLLAWYFVPVFLAWLATSTDVARLFFRRYIVVAAVPLWLAVAWPAVWLLPREELRRVGYCIPMLCLTLMAAWSRPTAAWTRHSAEDWRTAVQVMNRATRDRACPIFLRAGLIEDHQLKQPPVSTEFLAYCQFPLNGLYRLHNAETRFVSLPSDQEHVLAESHRTLIEQFGNAIVVVRGQRSTAEQFRDAWLRQLGEDRWVAESTTLQGLTLIHWSRRGPVKLGKSRRGNILTNACHARSGVARTL